MHLNDFDLKFFFSFFFFRSSLHANTLLDTHFLSQLLANSSKFELIYASFRSQISSPEIEFCKSGQFYREFSLSMLDLDVSVFFTEINYVLAQRLRKYKITMRIQKRKRTLHYTIKKINWKTENEIKWWKKWKKYENGWIRKIFINLASKKKMNESMMKPLDVLAMKIHTRPSH